MPWFLRKVVIRPMQKLFAKSAAECGEIMTKGLLETLPATGGFYLMDEKGKTIDKTKGIQHTDAERNVIWEKTLALLPDAVQ